MEEQQLSTLEQFSNWIGGVGGVVWGPYVLIPLLLGVGVIMMFGLKFIPLRKLGLAFGVMWKGRKHDPEHEGELSPFNALMTSMAATVGTGNIVGVATAILLGGPGAVFWMWITALFGMATKYCEALLAVKYREVTPDGSYVGGPMYYIKNGLGKNWSWLATLFAIFGMVASFGIGNMTQSNAIAANVTRLTGNAMPEWVVAVILLVIAGAVLIGGVKRIGSVAGTLVPIMALIYIIGGLIILAMNLSMVPVAFGLIFEHAFKPASAVGGFAGASLAMAIRFGVARGLFSNEAGLGSAPMAHATAITKSPVRQGMLGMLDPFLDTIVVCSITALVILVSGQWTSTEVDGAGTLTALAFNTAMPGAGQYLVTVGLVLFAFSTILGWCVYGERCTMYLFGHKASMPFRIVFTLAVPIGALSELTLVWNLADLFNGLMAIPNLIALLFLCPVVFKMTKEYFDDPSNKF
ncbi:sodium:alanine symporter family protein [Deltaproteobacteria bacterium Smac51]|nr:sodium:alanine symporter family protein [Deltaproteobacteria bacterium Smac51]